MDTLASPSVKSVTPSKPEFRTPWNHGARAYYEADTFKSALEGFKRKRKPLIFHMTNAGEAGNYDCDHCGNSLREAAVDSTSISKHSTWGYDPATKSIRGGVHYVCSWSQLFNALEKFERRIF